MMVAKPLMIFDFDGTLYRGDEPYLYYARRVADWLDPKTANDYLRRVQAHIAGSDMVPAADNWEAVVRLMEPFGQRLTPEQWQQAFMDTRRYMLSGECPLEVPQGLAEFLQDARGRATLVMASNSPYEAAVPLLEQMHLDHAFDVIRSEANKPAGLVATVREVMGPRYDPSRVLSIGDHYINDIAPGVQEGWTTGHISPRRIFPGPATFQAATLEEILPKARQWLSQYYEGD
ncbi:HAD family hydrolase [Sulfobacillus sp. hq2]|uniref:HAD family hydrolase n=1 Tax=Sulfobacillus TaxID=28033 RepID=UPI000CD1AE5D|nr:HAD family hydrolase [Sulfobacillus sp. hq2]POB09913.1 HAD family hydrolase [Sulfobacillus sp. hq2]